MQPQLLETRPSPERRFLPVKDIARNIWKSILTLATINLLVSCASATNTPTKVVEIVPPTPVLIQIDPHPVQKVENLIQTVCRLGLPGRVTLNINPGDIFTFEELIQISNSKIIADVLTLRMIDFTKDSKGFVHIKEHGKPPLPQDPRFANVLNANFSSPTNVMEVQENCFPKSP